VNTFDEVIYRAPLTTCYSILAKDCSSEQPKFAVMMKKVEKKSELKKLKIVTEENVIEIELEKRGELLVKVDNKIVKDDNKMENYGLTKRGDMITFENEDLLVRFDGLNVEIQMNEMYKNKQCGMCGHYDGESEGEFRRADNQETEDMEEFHRSFLSRDEECDVEEQRLSEKKNYKKYEKFEKSEESSEESYNESPFEKNNSYEKYEQEEDKETVEPIEKTRVIEYSGRVCFSKQPVPECPRKTYEKESETKEMKVKFACLERSSSEARRLLRESRREILSIESLPHSFVETLTVPKACVVY